MDIERLTLLRGGGSRCVSVCAENYSYPWLPIRAHPSQISGSVKQRTGALLHLEDHPAATAAITRLDRFRATRGCHAIDLLVAREEYATIGVRTIPVGLASERMQNRLLVGALCRGLQLEYRAAPNLFLILRASAGSTEDRCAVNNSVAPERDSRCRVCAIGTARKVV